MTITEYASKYHTDCRGLSSAWVISHQTLRQYVMYVRGHRGKASGARCPSPERQAEIERLTNGEITPADWPDRDDPQFARKEKAR